MVAVPDPPRGVRNQVSQGPGDAVLVPGAVLGEGVEAAAGEGPSEGVEQGLPDGPGELSLGHDASPVLEPVGSLTTYLAGSDQETLLFNTVRLISYCGVFCGNYWIGERARDDGLRENHVNLGDDDVARRLDVSRQRHDGRAHRVHRPGFRKEADARIARAVDQSPGAHRQVVVAVG